MSDERRVAVKPEKPAWIRHPGCKQRVFNDPIDIDSHNKFCPELLSDRIGKLLKRVELLEQAEVPAAASVDLDEVADWPEDASTSQAVPYVDDITDPTTATTPSGAWFDDEEEPLPGRI